MDATRVRSPHGRWWLPAEAIDRRTLRRDLALLSLSVLGLAALLVGQPFQSVGLEWLLLAVLTLIADWLPVPLGHAVRLRFVAPFLVAVAIVVGPAAVVITDMAALWAAFFGARLMESSTPTLVGRAVIRSLAISVASAGSFALVVFQLGASQLALLLAGVALALVHTAGHLLFPEGGRSWRLHPLAELRPGLSVSAIFLLLAAAAAVFAMNGFVGATVLLFGPILALRTYIEAKVRLAASSYQVVTTLAMMLQHAHPYTHRHLERVASFSEEVALRLGLDRARALRVHRAAVLHDIGKIAVDEAILDAPRKLTDDEFAHVQQHAAYGGEILLPVQDFREESTWIRHHHERPDGRGYPDGLLDPEIPIESKIIAVVDAFDAMTGGMEGRDGRPFREPMSVEAALAELDRCAGTQFDRKVVNTFRAVLEGGR